MSVTDPNADGTQLDMSQDDGGTGNPVYAEYLDRIPEEAREVAEEAFKDWDARTQQRFQEHADFRKQWEPLAQTGIHELSPEEVSWLVQFRGALEDPQVMQQWWDGYAQQNGLDGPPAMQDPTADDYGASYQDNSAIEAMIEQRLAPFTQALEQFGQRFEQQDMQYAEAQAMQYIEGQLAELEQKHGADFNREMVELFSSRYIDTDPMNAVPRAWEDWVKTRNGIEKAAMQPKLEQPPPAEGGGVPDTQPPALKSFKDAETTAKELLRNMNRT